MSPAQLAKRLWITAAAGLHLPERRIAGWGRGVLILGYHGIRRSTTQPHWLLVEEGEFDRQVRWLRQQFAVVTVDEAVAALAAGQDSRRLACITFDDGYANNLTIGLPILEQYRTPATIYLATAYVGSGSVLWTVRLRSMIDAHPEAIASLRLDGIGSFRIPSSSRERNALGLQLKGRLARLSPSRREEVLDELEAQVGGVTLSHEAFGFADHNAIRRAAASGLLSFGAHTVNHEILSRCARERVFPEVTDSVAAVRELGVPLSSTFAYPNGERGDFDEAAWEAVRQAGCLGALTTVPGFNRIGADLGALHRVLVSGHASFDAFRMAVAGLVRP